jgi:SAM-dependent methyltransferase
LRRLAESSRSAAVLLAVALLSASAIGTAAESEIDHLAEILDLRPGSSVADVGAGSGEISVAIAERVGKNGKVYSTEIDPKLVDRIRDTAKKAGAENVFAVTATKNQTGLPLDCCDAIFLREVYHHLTDPIEIDRALHVALRSGGRLAIIDYEPSERPGESVPAGVPANRGGHGVPKRIVAEELTGAGFELVKTVEWRISGTIRHYCMLFRKRSEAS